MRCFFQDRITIETHNIKIFCTLLKAGFIVCHWNLELVFKNDKLYIKKIYFESVSIKPWWCVMWHYKGNESYSYLCSVKLLFPWERSELKFLFCYFSTSYPSLILVQLWTFQSKHTFREIELLQNQIDVFTFVNKGLRGRVG